MAQGPTSDACAKKTELDAVDAPVENADAFLQHEPVIPDIHLIIFASGRMSGRTLTWRASPEMEFNSLQHWGDYDPVCVAEYVRLKSRCGDRVTTFVPDNLESILKRHGKRKLMTGQVETLTHLRLDESDSHVARMIAMFDQYRKGLEQEVLYSEKFPDA